MRDRAVSLYLVVETIAMKVAVVVGAVTLIGAGHPGGWLLLAWAFADIALKSYAAARLARPGR